MNEKEDCKVSEESGQGTVPEGTTQTTTRRKGQECGAVGKTNPPAETPRQRSDMQVLLKRLLIAVALVVVCWAILMAEKAYGVWVLSALAAILFVLGLLRKDKKPDGAGDDRPVVGGGKEG